MTQAKSAPFGCNHGRLAGRLAGRLTDWLHSELSLPAALTILTLSVASVCVCGDLKRGFCPSPSSLPHQPGSLSPSSLAVGSSRSAIRFLPSHPRSPASPSLLSSPSHHHSWSCLCPGRFDISPTRILSLPTDLRHHHRHSHLTRVSFRLDPLEVDHRTWPPLSRDRVRHTYFPLSITYSSIRLGFCVVRSLCVISSRSASFPSASNLVFVPDDVPPRLDSSLRPESPCPISFVHLRASASLVVRCFICGPTSRPRASIRLCRPSLVKLRASLVVTSTSHSPPACPHHLLRKTHQRSSAVLPSIRDCRRHPAVTDSLRQGAPRRSVTPLTLTSHRNSRKGSIRIYAVDLPLRLTFISRASRLSQGVSSNPRTPFTTGQPRARIVVDSQRRHHAPTGPSPSAHGRIQPQVFAAFKRADAC